MWPMTETNNGLCGNGNEPSGSVRAENIVDLIEESLTSPKGLLSCEFGNPFLARNLAGHTETNLLLYQNMS
jgi:hypothetical protein